MPVPNRLAALAIFMGGALLLAPTPAPGQSAPDATSAALVRQLDIVSSNLLAAAREVPEDRYSYRPTEEVRTFGEMIDHVADAHFGYCGAIAGGEQHDLARAEATTKSDIVRRFEASRDFCLDVYRSAGSGSLGETIDVFGGQESRAYVMIQNVSHSNLHYGNVVTYMRDVGLVPPSSQSGG